MSIMRTGGQRRLTLRAVGLALALLGGSLAFEIPGAFARDYGGLGYQIDVYRGIPQSTLLWYWNGSQWIAYHFSGWYTPTGNGTSSYLLTGFNDCRAVQSWWWSFSAAQSRPDLTAYGCYVASQYF